MLITEGAERSGFCPQGLIGAYPSFSESILRHPEKDLSEGVTPPREPPKHHEREFT